MIRWFCMIWSIIIYASDLLFWKCIFLFMDCMRTWYKDKILLLSLLLHFLLPHFLQKRFSISRRLCIHLTDYCRFCCRSAIFRDNLWSFWNSRLHWSLFWHKFLLIEEMLRWIFVHFVRNMIVAIKESIEIEHKWESESIIDLIASECFIVKVETLQDKIE